MKKAIHPIVSLIFAATSLSACGGSSACSVDQNPGIDDAFAKIEGARIPYRIEEAEGEKPHFIGRDGIPFLCNSSLMRFDELSCVDFLSLEETEPYFALAKETGFSFLDVPFMWSQIEKEKGQYDYSCIDAYLDYAKKYGLKLNLIWYGSWTDGECHGVNIPSYLYEDPVSYPVLQDLFSYEPFGYAKVMDWSNKNLLAREGKAVYSLMNEVDAWNKKNGDYDPVLMVQLGQGVDRFQRWRINAYQVQGKDGGLMGYEEAWDMAAKYYEAIAKGVKYSAYPAITRVEFCEQSAVTNYVRTAKKAEGVDLVCPTYLHSISTAKSGISSFAEEYEAMPLVNTENFADDLSYKNMLAEIAMGAVGFTSFTLSPARYYPLIPNGALYGKYDPESEEKFSAIGDRVIHMKAALSALGRVSSVAASASRKNFALLGLDNLVSETQKIYFPSGELIQFSNPADNFGYAIRSGGYLYIYSNLDASLTLENTVVVTASSGEEKDGEWSGGTPFALEGNKTIAMEGGKVYRLRLSNTKELPDVDELEKEGYKSIVDSIRG